ncbi:MAG TPA: kelch repeat-containing protein [Candidatus Acidoferrum sp.]|jgi:hypothetical protein|nr:kelch repeat-containing protein [Candidatus Acidoferrum sp.]
MTISKQVTVLSLIFLCWVLAHGADVWAQAPTWTELPTTGSPTHGSASVVYDAASNRAILFGGGFSGPCCTSYNDVWVLTNANGLGGTSVWSQLSPAAPNGTPPPRSFHSAVYDAANNRMIVFGGGQFAGGLFDPLFNDVWVLTDANGIGNTPTWIPISPSGTAPVPREGHGATFDAANNRMIVFGGGNNGIMDVPNDLWVLTNANGLGGTPAWIQLNPSSQLPAPNERFAVGYDPSTNRMIMFGGCCYWNNNTWLLTDANGLGSTPAWTQIAPYGPEPEIREVHAYGYDPSLNELIVFGYGSTLIYNDTWLLLSANDVAGTPFWNNLIPNNAPGSPPLPFNGTDSGVYDPASARLMLIKAEVDSQGGTVINPWVLDLGIRFLDFPLKGKSPYSTDISAVFDHDVNADATNAPLFYHPNTRVRTYTGEEGVKVCGHAPCTELVGTHSLVGYKNVQGQAFVVTGGGHYTGGSGCNNGPCNDFLFYTGHSGFDYPEPFGTTVILAPADGLLFIPSDDPVVLPDNTPGESVSKFNILAIDHGNGYASWFLHLGCEAGTNDRHCILNHGDFRGIDAHGNVICANLSTTGCPVKRGDVIGLVGNKGLLPLVSYAHLHFEVRKGLAENPGGLPTCSRPNCIPVDPYGWTGAKTDPYAQFLGGFPNVKLWK